MLEAILAGQRFVKHAVLFDEAVELADARQTQNALALHVQADRDVVVLKGQPGNGLDPSEIDGRTTKWGIDASGRAGRGGPPLRNRLPPRVVEALDVAGVLERARGESGG